MACRFIQNSALMPNKRARRRAVSAVTDRSPFTMDPIRVAGTRKAIASALTDISIGLRNSSLSTSPGCVVTRFGVATPLVVVDDFDIGRPFLGPSETNTPLIIDPDRVLAAGVAGGRFEPVGRRRPQVSEIACRMEHVEFRQHLLLDPAETLDEATHEEAFASAVAKRSDHKGGK